MKEGDCLHVLPRWEEFHRAQYQVSATSILKVKERIIQDAAGVFFVQGVKASQIITRLLKHQWKPQLQAWKPLHKAEKK